MSKQRALLSVTDKTGIVALARRLVYRDWQVISTGGTAKVIRADKIPCTLVEEITGFPEMLDGRLKTLHPMVHGGILANRSIPAHMEAIKAAGIWPIDMVAVNLYDFMGNPGIEQIDIGGPTMLRAAAKNGAGVIVMIDPSDYEPVVKAIDDDAFTEKMREVLVAKVFRHTGNYDRDIANWMDKQLADGVHFLNPKPSGH